MALLALVLALPMAAAEAETLAESGPTPEPTPTPRPIIILDAAHGGGVVGTRAAGFEESAYVYELVARVKVLLDQQGIEARLARPTSAAVSTSVRVVQANQSKATAYVAVHVNASFSEGSKGLRLFVAPRAGLAGSGAPLGWKTSQRDAAPQSMKLARELARNLVPAARRSRAIQHLPMAIFRGLAIPAAVIELGFVTNPQDLENMTAEGSMDSFAEAVARALVAYNGGEWEELGVQAP